MASRAYRECEEKLDDEKRGGGGGGEVWRVEGRK